MCNLIERAVASYGDTALLVLLVSINVTNSAALRASAHDRLLAARNAQYPSTAVPTVRGPRAAGGILVTAAQSVLSGEITAQQSGVTAAAAQPPEDRSNPAGTPEIPSNAGRPRLDGAPVQANTSGTAATEQEVQGSDQPSASQLPQDLFPARLEATIYQVQVPEERVLELDAQALEAKADSAPALAKALAEVGKTKVLYRIDQTVNLFGDKITLSALEPFVLGSRMTAAGRPTNVTSYQSLGLNILISAVTPPRDPNTGGVIAQLECSLSVPPPSDEETAPGVKSKALRKLEFRHSESPGLGKPSVLLSVIGAGGDKAAMLPTAYVLSYRLSATEGNTLHLAGQPVNTPGFARTAPNTTASASIGPVLPVHFQAVFYEVQAAAERVGALDAEALAREAATVDGL